MAVRSQGLSTPAKRPLLPPASAIPFSTDWWNRVYDQNIAALAQSEHSRQIPRCAAAYKKRVIVRAKTGAGQLLGLPDTNRGLSRPGPELGPVICMT